MKHVLILTLFVSLSTLLIADTDSKPTSAECAASAEILENMPLFTGPLLTPSGHVVPLGYWNFEPYLYVTANYGSYNNHGHLITGNHNTVVNVQLPFWVGLTSFMDFVIYPQFFSKFNDGQSSTQFGDFEAAIEFQLLMDEQTNYYPGIKLAVTQTFPSGRYNNLNPQKNGTDIGGQGAYSTEFTLVATRVWNIYRCHYLSWKSAVSYQFSVPVNVEGFNSYGGGYGTKGKVKPGYQIDVLAAIEYNFSIHWAFACDIEYLYIGKGSFSGVPGEVNGATALNAFPSSSQWSIAPAVEYNFNQYAGIVAGAWATFGGRNTLAFVSGVMAINLYY